MPGLVAGLALAGAHAPATAQYGASWASGDTAITTITFAGHSEAPAPTHRSAEEMARLFKTACLDTGGRPEAIDAAVADGRLALAAKTITVTATKKRPAYRLHLWSGPGVVVGRTDGFADVPEAQCSATFLPLALPTGAALTAGMTSVLGAPPSNAAEAVKKNGKPDRRFVPALDPVPGLGSRGDGQRHLDARQPLRAGRPGADGGSPPFRSAALMGSLGQ